MVQSRLEAFLLCIFFYFVEYLDGYFWLLSWKNPTKTKQKKQYNKNTPRAGLEPATTRLKALRSTNWATEATITVGVNMFKWKVSIVKWRKMVQNDNSNRWTKSQVYKKHKKKDVVTGIRTRVITATMWGPNH